MDAEQLLNQLGLHSYDGRGFVLTIYAVDLLMEYGEDTFPNLKRLHQAVSQKYPCSYDVFLSEIHKISQIAWERDAKRVCKYASRDLEYEPTASDFIDILYVYLSRHQPGKI